MASPVEVPKGLVPDRHEVRHLLHLLQVKQRPRLSPRLIRFVHQLCQYWRISQYMLGSCLENVARCQRSCGDGRPRFALHPVCSLVRLRQIGVQEGLHHRKATGCLFDFHTVALPDSLMSLLEQVALLT